jgi:hypothetical protein
MFCPARPWIQLCHQGSRPISESLSGIIPSPTPAPRKVVRDIELRVELLLWLKRHDRVFGALRDPEFDDFLGRDLDGFAGRRIPAHARFPFHSDQTHHW